MNLWIICLTLICALYTSASDASDGYKPIKIAHKTYEPLMGADKSLNPIILLHGLMATKESWDDFAPLIADKTRRKIYAYDARNHGDSEFTEEATLEHAINDHFHFMDKMNIEKAVLIGQSMGGYLAAQIALAKPERVESVFSEDMHLRKLPDDKLSLIKSFIQGWVFAASWVPGDLDEGEAVKYLLDMLFYFAPKDPSVEREKKSLYKTKYVLKRAPREKWKWIPRFISEGQWLPRLFSDYQWLSRFNSDVQWLPSFNSDVILRTLSDPDEFFKEPKGQFKGTAFFIYAGLSGFQVGDEEDYIRKHFPNVEMVEFPFSGHNIHAEFPDEFVRVIVHGMKHYNKKTEL